MNILPANRFSLDELTEAFNRGFENYVVPVQTTPQVFDFKVFSEGISLERSRVLSADGRLVGIGLAALSGESGWIGGMGIVPECRGHGLGRRLLDAVTASCVESGAERVFLEVIARNKAAVALYERAGFRTLRDLLVLEARTIELVSTDGHRLEEIGVEMLDAYDAFHPVALAWQRRADVLRRVAARRPVECLGLGDDNGIGACAMVEPADEVARIFDLGARPGRESNILILLSLLGDRFPGMGFRLVNEPADGPLVSVLERAGFTEMLRQHEMAWTPAD